MSLGLGIKLGLGVGAGSGSDTPQRLSNLKTAVFGDSLSANQGSYTSFMIDDGQNPWTITKGNPTVINIPATHPYQTGQKVMFYGWVGVPELCDVTYTVTRTSATQLTIDGLDSTGWSSTYIKYGRMITPEQESTSVGTYNNKFTSPSGYMGNANMMLGDRFDFDIKYNRGVVGDSTTSFVSRLQYDLPAKLAGTINCVHMMGGRNDANSLVAASTIYTNLLACRQYIWDTFGSTTLVIWATVTPNNGASGAVNAITTELNDLIRASGTDYCLIADYALAVDDGTGQWLPGTNVDTQHPQAAGGQKEGRVLKNLIVPKYGRGEGFILRSNNLITNPNMTGTGGSAAGITSTGFAAGYTGTISGPAPTGARIFAKDSLDRQLMSISQAQSADPTFANNNSVFSFRQDVLAASLVVGAEYVFEVEWEFLNFTGGGIITQISAGTSTLTTPSTNTVGLGPVSGTPVAPFDTTLLLAESAIQPLFTRTPRIKFQSGQTTFRNTWTIRWNNTAGAVNADFRIRRVQLYRVY